MDKCTRQISLIYELKHFNDRLEATLGTRGFSRVRRVFSRCKRVYSGFCEVGCRPATQPFLMRHATLLEERCVKTLKTAV